MVDSRKANTPVVVRKIEELRRSVLEWRGTGARIALVPTMGALHAGHLALVKAARETADRVVVSIFVNPTQFAPNEDFASYPRDELADVGKLVGTGTDAVFAPGVAEMYPQGFATSVIVGGPAEGLESAYRPHFFTGVATVVSKLLLACLPDSALFGEKDYQQLLVIRRMVADLAIPVGIVGCPTLREGDGLALSSRNAYLGPAERLLAPRLHAALEEAAALIRSGSPAANAVERARRDLSDAGFRVDYVEARNGLTLAAIADSSAEPVRILAAAWLGRTRLIDNIAV